MKVALIGYGKMGKIIDSVAPDRHVDIVARIDVKDCPLTADKVQDANVCIDFSHPEAVLKTIGQLCEWGKDIVIGTTGWDSHLTSVRALVEGSEVGAIYSPNFSIGMQVYGRLVKEAAHLFDRVGEYDAGGFELHHRSKGDSPSGSAIALAERITHEMQDKKKPVYERMHREIMPEELQFASLRVGQHPGRHTVFFDSQADTIELTHRARTREGFAVGALMAAEWVYEKKGLYTMDNLIDALLKERGPRKP